MPSASAAFDVIAGFGDRAERIVHLHEVPERVARHADWPDWLHADVRAALERSGVSRPWQHQVDAANLARNGENIVVATGTASGKSLGYLMPSLTSVLEGLDSIDGRGSTVIYISPTKALAADQLNAIEELGIKGVRAATYDGDTSLDSRDWIRRHANYVLTNPDLLHRSLLPGHPRWSSFLKACTHIVIDECHGYRGLFGSHVSAVLRRLLRMARYYGANPTVIAASATIADPAGSLSRLTGQPAVAVTDDASPHSAGKFVLWEPPLLPGGGGEHDAPVRRTAITESGTLLADLVAGGIRTIAFIRSRRGSEAMAATARRLLADVDDTLPRKVAAYRGGYLPEERRLLESALRRGQLLAVASTNALELGVDISGLDAVIIAGWPGTRASLWQQAGRAGRAGADWLAIFVARDDPLDTFLVHHPESIFETSVEASVFDTDNPYVLAGHLCAAAEELPLTESDLALFSDSARGIVDILVQRGLLRKRPAGWFWTKREAAAGLTDLRGAGGPPVRVVDHATGRLMGTVDAASAHAQVHTGAVYMHQGATFLVDALDEEDGVALVQPAHPDYTTQARNVTEIRVLEPAWTKLWGNGVRLSFGTVQVSEQVVSYLRRQLVTNQVIAEEPLDLPARELSTKAVWWTLPKDLLEQAEIGPAEVPGAAHAAEHAAIGLLPLLATCDRWDIGGVSTALHQDTGQATIFVYDGHPGGAGFAERGAHAANVWLGATAAAIAACECPEGCPSCVQSPKCGNGNEPLDKEAALTLLRAMLDGASPDDSAEVPGGAVEVPASSGLLTSPGLSAPPYRPEPADLPAPADRAASADRPATP
ncbi:DEAD/DEAH box helicase [Saxibacter everestensis]|uniref:DEAD/DEAH box helicase n=1 Tax=Saxibacter everestensis TaxID=2909229 RepID=A0ABY8QQ03_9MICO|nr:DEAD/DEAH box helicase [Brevibacteriaceae bacterium ZFBP1038]